jgi:hypothetical protein
MTDDKRPDEVPSEPATPAARPADVDSASRTPGDRALEVSTSRTPLPYPDLMAPVPLAASPPLAARVLAFTSILVGGLLGALIGYGTADLMAGTPVWAALGAVVGAAAGAVGVGVVASLTLRAMNEWHAVHHPEASEPAAPDQGSRPHDGRGNGSRGRREP